MATFGNHLRPFFSELLMQTLEASVVSELGNNATGCSLIKHFKAIGTLIHSEHSFNVIYSKLFNSLNAKVAII